MSHIRFNHVFSLLMLLAALSAWFSPGVSDRAQAHLQGLFLPVSKPIYALGSFVRDKTVPRRVRDDGSPDHARDAKEIIQENLDLRMQIATLRADLARLQELNADREKVGDLRSRCIPVEISGGDSGLIDSRSIGGGSRRGLVDGMPVICPDGVVGRLTKVGVASSRVQLITDNGVRPTVSFMRIEKDEAGKAHMVNVSYPDCVAIGQGKGRMLVVNQPWKELSRSVKVNDWVMLNDKDQYWRGLVYRIGRVSAVEKSEREFGQIVIESSVDPTRLKEVMVVVK